MGSCASPDARRPATRLAVALVIAGGLLAGCADKHVILSYAPPAEIRRIAATGALTVYAFDDMRGTEGDHDPYRVGGVYGRYGNRVTKVMTQAPFDRTLAEALAAGFRAAGLEVVVAAGEHYRPGATRTATPFALAGEIHDFSTEARFTTSAHIGGVVRLYDRDGTLLVARDLSERETVGIRLGGLLASTDRLEQALNKALATFVRRVVDAPELDAALTTDGSTGRAPTSSLVPPASRRQP